MLNSTISRVRTRRGLVGFLSLFLALTLGACGGSGGGGTATTVATSGPRYALVPNYADNSVSTYVVDAATGRMKWIHRATAGINPVDVVIDPSGTHAYVAAKGNSRVYQYIINADGSLVSMAAVSVQAGSSPASITVDPSGKYVYVANQGANDITAYAIGAGGALGQVFCGGTGTVCATGDAPDFAAGTAPYSVTVDPSGKYAYVANSGSNDISAYTIGSDGALTQISCGAPGTTGCSGSTAPTNFAAGPSPQSVTVDPSGKYAYVASNGGNNIWQYSINTDGSLTLLTPAAVLAGSSPVSVTVDPSGKYAYVVNKGVNDVTAYAIGSGGVLKQIYCGGTGTVCETGDAANFAAGTAPVSITIGPRGNHVYVANNGGNTVSQYSIGADGSLSPVSPGTTPAYTGPNALALTHGTAVTAVPKYAYVPNGVSGYISEYRIGTDGSLIVGYATAWAGTGPSSFTVDPSGKYAYVANLKSNDVSAYTIGSNGALAQISCGAPGTSGCSGSTAPTNFAAGTSPASIAVDPAGKYAYAVNEGGTDVSAYTINGDGSLTQISCGGGTGCSNTTNFAAGTNPASVTVDPAGKYAYVANLNSNDVSAYTIGSNGALAQISCGAPGTAGCSGSTAPTNFAAGTNPVSVTVDPSGKYAYVANGASSDISAYTIGSNGALTQITCTSGCSAFHPANFAAGSQAFSITVDPSGKYAYVASYGSANVFQFTIGADGSLTLMTTVAVVAGTNPVSVTVDPSGKYAYVANNSSNNVSQYTIGPNGGLAALGMVAAGTGPASICTVGTWN